MREEFTIKFWDPFEGKEIGMLQKPVTCFDFNINGTILATGAFDGSITLWNIDKETQNYNEIITLYGHHDRINSLSFNSEGTMLASGSGSVYYNDYSVRLWDISSITNSSTFQSRSKFINSIKFHPKDPIFASSSTDGAIKLWDIVSGDNIKILTGYSPESFIHLTSTLVVNCLQQ